MSEKKVEGRDIMVVYEMLDRVFDRGVYDYLRRIIDEGVEDEMVLVWLRDRVVRKMRVVDLLAYAVEEGMYKDRDWDVYYKVFGGRGRDMLREAMYYVALYDGVYNLFRVHHPMLYGAFLLKGPLIYLFYVQLMLWYLINDVTLFKVVFKYSLDSEDVKRIIGRLESFFVKYYMYSSIVPFGGERLIKNLSDRFWVYSPFIGMRGDKDVFGYLKDVFMSGYGLDLEGLRKRVKMYDDLIKEMLSRVSSSE